MAITQEEILQLTVSMFNASLGANYLADIESANFATTADLAAYYGTLTQFTSQFDGMTDAEQVTAMLSNFGLDSTNTAAFDYFTAQVAAGVSNAVTLQAADAYLATQTAEVLATYNLTDAAATLVNKTAAATYYSVTQGLSATTVDDLKATVSTITEDTTTVTTANAAVDTAVASTTTAAALATLADAKAALVAFQDAAPVLDTDYSKDDLTDVAAGESTDIVADVLTTYNSVAGQGSFTALSATFGAKDAAIQDGYIAANNTTLQTAVTSAGIELPTNMAALLETMSTKEATLLADLKADTASAVNLALEETAFTTPAAVTTIVYAADYVAATDYSAATTFIISEGKAYIGQDGTGTPVALADLVEATTVARVTELQTAYDANVATIAAVAASTTALENAVEDVILAENSQDTILGGAASLTGVTTGAIATTSVINIDNGATETVTVNLSTVPVNVYDAADDVQEVTTVALQNLFAAETYIFDGVTITATANATAAELAAYIAGGTDANLGGLGANSTTTVSISGTTATYTATETGVAVDLVVTGTGGNDASTTAAVATVETQGTGTASVALTAAAPLAVILDAAITAQSDFATLVEDFIAARALNTDAIALNAAITDATTAITNDADLVEDAGLGLTLVELDSTVTVAASDAEIFLFEEDEDASFTGFAADDSIFVGTNFTVFASDDEDAVIANNLGDVSILEAIVIDNGTDTTIYFEDDVFGGSTAGSDNVTSVQLTGITDMTVAIDANGFLTVA